MGKDGGVRDGDPFGENGGVLLWCEPCRGTDLRKMHLFCKVRVIYGEPMPAAQFAMEGRRDTKKLRANKQALLEAWEKMGA